MIALNPQPDPCFLRREFTGLARAFFSFGLRCLRVSSHRQDYSIKLACWAIIGQRQDRAVDGLSLVKPSV